MRRTYKKLQSLEVDLVGILPFLKNDFHNQDSDSNFQYEHGIKEAQKIYSLEIEASQAIETYVFSHMMPMDAFGSKFIMKEVDTFRYFKDPIFEQHQSIVITGEHIFITCTEEDEAWGIQIRSKSLTRI